mmetsp:Transcript_16252/g.33946  ORF Transcript_16252/g.33946 Transcript_16252/m.33946 type:complete len:279 (-) Transcript_16252:521-1357(-)
MLERQLLAIDEEFEIVRYVKVSLGQLLLQGPHILLHADAVLVGRCRPRLFVVHPVDHLVQYDCKDVIAVVESVANVVEFSAETFDADGEIEGTARLGGSVFGDASGDVLVVGLGEEGLHLAMEGGVVGSVGVVELEGGQVTPLQPLQTLRHDPQLHLVVPPVLDQHERQLAERRTALLEAHPVLANVPRPRMDLGGVVHLQHLGQRADLLVRVVDDAHPRRGGRGAVQIAAAAVRVGRVVGVGVDVHPAHEGRGAAAARRRHRRRVEEELQLTGDGGV